MLEAGENLFDLLVISDCFAGTGSGSFSHSAARTIGKTGRLYSYEFHEDRFKQARYVYCS